MSRHQRRYRRAYNPGADAARKHIEAAKRLSSELGGTDQDVKSYFFSLTPSQLEPILNEYGNLYGAAARDYAATTIPRWRSGRVHMSGMVAERLFNLLPNRMPFSEKLKLVESLWNSLGPSSQKTIRAGVAEETEIIVAKVSEHLEQTVSAFRIPDALETRFAWLANGDVSVKQELLNHLRSVERSMAMHSARQHLPVLQEHLRNDVAQHTRRAAHILSVGKHQIELVLDRNSNGVVVEDTKLSFTPVTSSKSNIGAWLIPTALVLAVAIMILFLASKH